MTSWQLIFVQSKVNNGAYDGERLFARNWDWPKETWFQTRLRDCRRGNHKRFEASTPTELSIS
jgi:hypothetical protein